MLHLLVLSAIVGCGVQEKTKAKILTNEVPISESDIGKDTEIYNLELNNLISYMATDEKSFKRGMPALVAKIQRSDSELKDEEAKTIANLLSKYSNDFEDKLYTVLGIKKNEIHVNSIVELNQVYIDLMYSDIEVTQSMENILIQHLNTTLLNYESQYSSTEELTDIIEYYSNKILSESSRNGANTAFAKYSSLSKILPGTSHVLFGEVIRDIRLSKHSSISNHLAYLDLLKGYVLNTNSFDTAEGTNILNSAINNIKWIRDQVNNKKVEVTVLFDSLSNYLSLFELNQEISDKNNFRNSINDIYFNVVNSVKPILRNVAVELDVDLLQKLTVHPYIKVLINKARIIQNLEPIYTFDSEVRISKLFAIERKQFSSDMREDSAPNKFIDDFYNVISLKHSIELQTRKVGPVKSLADENNATYNLLLDSLLSSLNFLYDKKIERSSLYTDSSKNNDLFISISEEYDEIESGVFKISYCQESTENCPSRKLQPGIYIPPKGIKNFNKIEMFGAEIDMSPLAMILTKGIDFQISMESIDGLWIDSTGMVGSELSLSTDESKYSLPQITNFSQPIVDGNFTTWTLMHRAANHLKKQPKSEDGTDAGNVVILSGFDFSLSTIPLIKSSGGKGGDGSIGLSTKVNYSQRYKDASFAGLNRNNKIELVEQYLTILPGTCLNSLPLKSGTATIKAEPRVYRPYPPSAFKLDHANAEINEKDSKDKRVNNITTKQFPIYRGKGGIGGNGGNSGQFSFSGPETEKYSHLFNNIISTPGEGGLGGEAGECGAGSTAQYTGERGIDGAI